MLSSPMFRRLANVLAQQSIPCHLATTRKELDAIARLRYTVHVREQNVDIPEADHAAKRIWYDDDDKPGVLHFYAGTADEMLGSSRVRVWEPGQVPSSSAEFYSISSLPGIERRRTCDVTKLMVLPKLRGTAAMSALSAYSLYHTVSEHHVDLMFACCAPGLLRAYRAIGLRTFGGQIKHTAWGLVIPLIGVTHDVEHTKRIGSPWFPALRRLKREGKLPDDIPEYRALAERDRSAISEPAEVLRELRTFAGGGRSRFLGKLSPQAIEALAPYGMILDIPPGVRVCSKGVAEREVFVILSGNFTVTDNGARVATLQEGSVFGEIALMSEVGRRTADVYSATPARVLVLRRKFLASLRASRPAMALTIHESLVQELLHKIAGEQPQEAAHQHAA